MILTTVEPEISILQVSAFVQSISTLDEDATVTSQFVAPVQSITTHFTVVKVV